MEHKDYKLEIIYFLLQERGHARGIANKLGTNHMLVARKLAELKKENVVDCVQEGKNKTYFLKKTTEARSYVLITENYRLIKTIEKYPWLRSIIEKIQKNQKIDIAVLFGSYAKCTASKNSDIDLFIESTDLNLRKELKLLDSKLSLKIGEYNKESMLIKEIEQNHVVVKGVEHFYEKNQFFK
jgi:predicted nucleotidyltransferase